MLYNSEWGDGSDEQNVAMRAAVNNSTATFSQTVKITTTGGTVYNFTDAELYQGGLSFENAICADGQYAWATMVTGRCTVKVFDTNRTWASIDWYGARIEPNITVSFDYEGSSLSATFPKGKYTCSGQKWNNGVLIINGLDDIDKLNVPFQKSWYSSTTGLGVEQILTTIFNKCNIAYNWSDWYYPTPYSESISISSFDNYTCRDVVLMCLWFGSYVIMTSTGYIVNGLTSYGDIDLRGHHDLITSKYSFSYSDMIQVGNFKILNEDGSVWVESDQAGFSTNYVISLVKNPIMEDIGKHDIETIYVITLQVDYALLQYYIADVNAVENPLIEAGDGIFIYDEISGQTKLIVASNVSYTFGQGTRVSSYAQPVRENLASGYTPGERIIQQINATYRTDRLKAANDVYNLIMQRDGNLVVYKNGSAVWQTGVEGLRLPALKRKTMTARTSANGNVGLGLSLADNIVYAVYTTTNNGTVCSPYTGNGSSWYVHCSADSGSGAAVANTSLTFVVFYAETTTGSL